MRILEQNCPYKNSKLQFPFFINQNLVHFLKIVGYLKCHCKYASKLECNISRMKMDGLWPEFAKNSIIQFDWLETSILCLKNRTVWTISSVYFRKPFSFNNPKCRVLHCSCTYYTWPATFRLKDCLDSAPWITHFDSKTVNFLYIPLYFGMKMDCLESECAQKRTVQFSLDGAV